jgi:8-oxo-dGTP pyrophosphatase MutT (NUDIX family)
MTTHAPAPAHPSATVMLVRDGRAGLEVFMMARTRPMDGAMGALVFPGGKVDAEDHAPEWQGLDVPAARPERAFWIAAVRETFEEAGILIARQAAPPSMPVAAGLAARLVADQRDHLLDRATTFLAIMTGAGLEPALEAMVPFAHWRTPIDLPKRFDTHFFLVTAPSEQEARHDGREMAECRWVAPGAVMAEAAAGKRTLVPATRLNLELLSESPTVAEAFTAARQRTIVTVMPESIRTEAGWRVRIPAGAGYRTTELPSGRK